jgi:hypothetical protein
VSARKLIVSDQKYPSLILTNTLRVLQQLEACRERAAGYLASQVYETESESYWLHSPAHDPALRPGHLLYGTWAGTFASTLLGVDFDNEKRVRIARALNKFQDADGSYLMPGVAPADMKGHNQEYFKFHCSNYALGALHALQQIPREQLTFMEDFKTGQQLGEWLDRRDWTKPWTEGNNIVNLASFYAALAEQGREWAYERLLDLAEWHDANQNSSTGFWHSTKTTDLRSLLHAMAGAAHNLHIYYYLGRAAPRPTKIVDSCLRQGYLGIRSACVDIDMVDILVNFRHHHYRREKIDLILRRYLEELLQIQNADGGFSDTYVTPEKLYGLTTANGVSVTWVTWFRLTTIGMIACSLFPEERLRWRFRSTMGSGYCNLRHSLQGCADSDANAWDLPSRTKVWLSTRRKSRFLRHRLTWVVRQKLAGAKQCQP